MNVSPGAPLLPIAEHYEALGWQLVPCRWHRSKDRSGDTPMCGVTGGAPFLLASEACADWLTLAPEGGSDTARGSGAKPAVRPPLHVIGLDVDHGYGGKTGGDTLVNAEMVLGPLPGTYSLTARGPCQPSRRLWYRIPAGLVITDRFFVQFGSCIETIRTGHRFSWATPAVHTKGGRVIGPVLWYDQDHQVVQMPHVDHLAELPAAWVQAAQELAATPRTEGVPVNADGCTEITERHANAIVAKLTQRLYDPELRGGAFRGVLFGLASAVARRGAARGLDSSEVDEEIRELFAGHPWRTYPNDRDELWIKDGIEQGSGQPWTFVRETFFGFDVEQLQARFAPQVSARAQGATAEEIETFLASFTGYRSPRRLGHRVAWMNSGNLMGHARALVADAIAGYYPADRAVSALVTACPQPRLHRSRHPPADGLRCSGSGTELKGDCQVSRMDALLNEAEQREADVVAELTELGRSHGAESRAADVIAKAVLVGRFRYSPALGWMEWDGRHWDTDDVAEPRILETVRLFMDTAERDYRTKATATETRTQELIKVFAARDADEEYNEKGKVNVKTLLSSELVTDEERKAYKSMLDELMHNTQQANIWLNLLSAGKVSAVTKLCRGMDEVITRAKEFDAHPDLLNCLNGVLDLSTGQLAAHDPSFMMTHLADTLYDPSITSPVWDKILSAVHPECQDWYQIRMGQAATGHPPDNDELLLQEGGGENGKSAMMLVLMRALGSYAGLISHRVLIAQPGQHPTELMDLRGLRLALLEETPEEGRLDPQQVKNTVGTPRITARRMRCDPVTFVASHTLVINTNHHPQVDSTDWGTWRRLKSMPWPYRFLKPGQAAATEWDRPGDSTLKRRLEREPDAATAALSWLVGGAMTWYAHGQVSPEDPQAVKDSTDQWRQKSDVGYRFAEERLVAAPDHFITADMMRIELLAFLASEGKQPWSSQTINIRLKASMQAAKIVVGVTPEKPATVRQGDVESRPPFRPTQWEAGERSAPQWIPERAGRSIRQWRGVRFKTEAEMKVDVSHLKVV